MGEAMIHLSRNGKYAWRIGADIRWLSPYNRWFTW